MTRTFCRFRCSIGLFLLTILGGTLVGCGTVQGFGEDLSAASVSVQEAFLGSDPDAPPID